MFYPVIIFAYNRAELLKNCIDSVAANIGADKTLLYIFVDGPKDDTVIPKVEEVRNVARCIDKSLFADVITDFSVKNRGLAASVIEGVTKVLKRHGAAIVVEDDNVVAKDFLDYMNRALEFYRDDKSIWSVGAYIPRMTFPSDYRSDIFLTQRISSQVWATWYDRWKKTDWKLLDYEAFRHNHKLRRSFNEWGNDRANLLDEKMAGRIDSWAIRFDYAMWKNGAYNIMPRHTRSCNFGAGKDATHNKDESMYKLFPTEFSTDVKPVKFEKKPKTDERLRAEYCRVFSLPEKYLAKQYILRYFERRKAR